MAKKKLVGYTIQVYLDDGRIFEYGVPTEEKVREHSHAIATSGYRHCTADGVFEHYPAYRVTKVKSTNITTNYPDQVRGT